MSRVGVIVALVVAVALAAAAVFLLRQPPTASVVSGPLLQVEAARITEIRVEAPDARPQLARRTGQGSWVIELGDGLPWPAMGERIRPALRILSNLEQVRAAERDAALGRAATVRLTLDDGSSRTLRVGVRPLAGAALAEIETPEGPRRGWVDAKLVEMLVGTGMGEWRDRSAMGQLGAEVSRLTLKAGGKELAFGRVEGKWALMSPVAEACEPDALGRLFTLIGQASVVDFLDAGPPAETGLDSPVAVLTAESTYRDPADPARVSTEVRSLEVGRMADMGGRNVFARLSGETLAPGSTGKWRRVVVVNGQPLSEISNDPASYIARRCLQTPSSEIGRLEVYGKEGTGLVAALERGLDGWSRLGGPESKPLTGAEAASLQGLLDLLTQTPAEAVQLSEPAGVATLATLEVQSIGGMPFARVSVGQLADGRPVLASERVWRVYPAAAAGPGSAIQWLAGLVGTAAGR
jgi:hypothetical protein